MLVTEIDLNTLFAPLKGAKAILLGLSGGPDSLAALALLSEWGAHPPLFAATFDHGFRSDARAEAKQCALICARFNVPHAILTWSGAKPTTRIQEDAREARYAALITHAKAMGADYLVTAHHADDQMETILFRLMRGSSIGGLAGMRAMIERDGITHARPFLTLRKKDLVDLCEARGLAYLRDPSNEDPRFARTQMRRLSPQLEEAGLGPDIFSRLARRAARAEEALAHMAHELAQEARMEQTDQAIRLDGKRLMGAPEELVLRVVMAEIGQMGQPPRLEQAEPLALNLLASLRQGEAFRATLGGALIEARRDRIVVIARETPRKSGLPGT